jgi:hypothetical protein
VRRSDVLDFHRGSIFDTFYSRQTGLQTKYTSMYQIVCVREDTDGSFPVACGFSNAEEAWETARGWITRRFGEAAYDHNEECWWLRDDEGNLVRVMVDKAA